MLKKFGLEDSKPTRMPISMEIKLTKDEKADSVNITKYRGMIGSLLYLVASRPDIMFSVCLCARFQENPKTTCRISMDLRMDKSWAANSSYSWSVVDFLKGTSLRYALTYNPTIYDSLVKQFWQTVTVRTHANETQQLVASIDSKEYTITEASVRSKLQLADATGIHNLWGMLLRVN
ncbi:hypothetical protein Tco_0787752 [Tanacetum coccineum]